MRAPTRRSFLQQLALAVTLLGAPASRIRPEDPDEERLRQWTTRLRGEGFGSAAAPLGSGVVRVGELAAGTPYLAGALDGYLQGSFDAAQEPLSLSLTHFDCVTLVESCLAVARVARDEGPASWEGFGRQVERMRYRGGVRRGYASRLHYFSEWLTDGAARGLVQELGAESGAVDDSRPLRFMSEHRGSYPALANAGVFDEIVAMERRLDAAPRRLIPTARIPEISAEIRSGDILAFATAIPGLDVTHAALAYRDHTNTLRVLHAPLSGGVVEVSRLPLPAYVAAIRRSTGILVARPVG